MNDFNGDVMEIKGLSQAVQEHEARLQAFLELSPDKVLEAIEEACIGTDIVIAGFDNADALNAGESISMLAVLRLRDALECVSLWIDQHHKEKSEASAAGEEDL